MSKLMTTNDLVASVKRRAMLPTDQVTFTKQDIIDILNEEMDAGILTTLMSVHEEYLVVFQDNPLNITPKEYSIPYRAIGNKLRAAMYYDPAGNYTKMVQIELEDITMTTNRYVNIVGAFHVLNDKIILVNTVTDTGTLRLYYYITPSKLVDDKYGATILAINEATGEVTVDKLPSNFTVGGSYDITRARSPNKLMVFDVPNVGINTTNKILTFNIDDLKTTASNSTANDPVKTLDIKVGDYITVAQETIVPQIPMEMHPLMAQRAAVAILEAQNDTQGLQAAVRKQQELEKTVLDLIDNRVESANHKCNNLYSPLQQTDLRYRRRFY